MQVNLIKTLKKVGEKTYTNFYLVLPSGSKVAIKTAFERAGDFYLLKEYADYVKPQEPKEKA